MTSEKEEAGLPPRESKGEQEIRNVISALAKTNLVTEGGPVVPVRPAQSRIEEARIAFRNNELDRAMACVAKAIKDFDEIVRQWERVVREVEDRAKSGISVLKWRRIQGFHNQRRPIIRSTETALLRLRDVLGEIKEENQRQVNQADE